MTGLEFLVIATTLGFDRRVRGPFGGPCFFRDEKCAPFVALGTTGWC